MTDTFSKSKRSEIMRAVKSHGNKSTELKLICTFKKLGIIGWRRKHKLYGNPDFVFLDKRVAIFTDGCFWHGHECRNINPKNNSAYWDEKISKNKARDMKVSRKLRLMGWHVYRLWECCIKREYIPPRLLKILTEK